MVRKKKKVAVDIVWYFVMITASLFMMLPFYWTLATSFKPDTDIFSRASFWIPQHLTFAHYIKVFMTIPFARYFLNSLYLAVVGCFTNLFLGSLAGYSFAKLKFRGKRFLFLTLISSIMIPDIITMIPKFLILKNFPLVGGNDILGRGGQGFIDTFSAIILPGAVGGFAVFFMKQFFESLPNELGDSARIDGCGEFSIFLRVYFPLTKAALATLGILTFQAGWNGLLWPLIVLNSPEKMTVQVGISTFVHNYSMDFGPLMAGTIVNILPMIILFVYAQKYFVQGIAFTGSKN
jgi:multiple sugar transport system permease protein